MKGRILDGWREERCPILSGIFFPDDSVMAIAAADATELGAPRPTGFAARHSLPDDVAHWTSLNTLDESSRGDLRASVGEGGLGADGFVAVERDGVLLWLAFFDFSNPFEAVTLVDDHVEARSSHHCHWKFDIASPQLLSVTRAHEDEP